MAQTILFDNEEIRDATHVPRFVKHESAPERNVATAPRAREDGDSFIAERYGQKRVLLQGVLTGTSEADLEAAIDTFKELFSRQEKELKIDWAGGTLTFVATCARHDFDRDHFHRLFVPWSAEFSVISGEGVGAEVVIDNDVSHNVNVAFPYEETLEFEGSAKPKPYIRVKAGASFPNIIKGMELKNVDTGERVCVTYKAGAWGENGYFAFDFETLKAYLFRFVGAPVEEVDFYGTMPHFSIGDNDIEIMLGGMVAQASLDEGSDPSGLGSVTIDADTTYRAQSFEVPYTDTTFRQILIAIGKTGSPNNLWVRIETDNGGKPSGDLVTADSRGLITAASVGASKAWITVPLDAEITLKAATRYWIVLKPVGGLDGANYYSIAVASEDYQRGFMSLSVNEGASWTAYPASDLVFSLRWGGVRTTGGAAGTFKLYVSYFKRYL